MSRDWILIILLHCCAFVASLDYCYKKHNCPLKESNSFFEKKYTGKGVHASNCNKAKGRFNKRKVISILKYIRNKMAHKPTFVDHPLLYRKKNHKMKMLVSDCKISVPYLDS